jgi:hypothetical protein
MMQYRKDTIMNRTFLLGAAAVALSLGAVNAYAGVPYNSPYATWEPQAIDPEVSPNGRDFVSGVPPYAANTYNPGPFGIVGAVGGAVLGAGAAVLGAADNVVTGGYYGNGGNGYGAAAYEAQPNPGVSITNGDETSDAGYGNGSNGRAAATADQAYGGGFSPSTQTYAYNDAGSGLGYGGASEGRAAFEDGAPVAAVQPPAVLGPDSIPTIEDRTYFSRGR